MLVAIDAGHGSKTAGKRTPDGYLEHWINVKCAYYFSQALARCGIKTFPVGWNDKNATDDEDVALQVRQRMIKKAGCTYSVSWHANAYGNGKTYNDANGVETLISDKSAGDSLSLARHVQKELVKGTGQTNRGVKEKALSMCNCGAMGTKAAILIEVGFMTNVKEANLMKTEVFCREQAEDAARGLCNYLGIPYVADAVPPQEGINALPPQEGINALPPQETANAAPAADMAPQISGVTAPGTNAVSAAANTAQQTSGATASNELGTSALRSEYYPKYTGSSSSIVDALRAVGEKDVSFTHRKRIGEANGLSDVGTAKTNTKMLELLKKGKLKKAK